MKFEQVFKNYKIVVDFGYKHYNWRISVVDCSEDESEALTVISCERGIKVGVSRILPTNGSDAFDLANMYQEALAIANTNNLTVDLLVQLGYNVVK